MGIEKDGFIEEAVEIEMSIPQEVSDDLKKASDSLTKSLAQLPESVASLIKEAIGLLAKAVGYSYKYPYKYKYPAPKKAEESDVSEPIAKAIIDLQESVVKLTNEKAELQKLVQK